MPTTVTAMKKPTAQPKPNPEQIIHKRASATASDSRGLRFSIYPTPDLMARIDKARAGRPGMPDMSVNQWVLNAILDKLDTEARQ